MVAMHPGSLWSYMAWVHGHCESECESTLEIHRMLKVGNMGTAISETKLMDKWAASKRTQVSAIVCIKLLPLLENGLELNFKALC